MDNHALEVVEVEGSCCENTRTLDHFCGNGALLTKKRSRCNNCGTATHAEVWRSNDNPPRIYLRKYCPDCGVTSSRLSSDARFYFARSADEACGCGPGGCGPTPLGANAQTGSQLHTCTLVVEIVRDCNLACPTCYADSPKASNTGTESFLTLDELKAQVLPVLEKQGKIDILQLSGGEPTLHPQLLDIIAWAGTESRILDILLNTNGTRMADPLFARSVAKVAPRGRFSVYLQYDGDAEAGQSALRGGDMRTIRNRAIRQCGSLNIPIALVMTVTHDNKFNCASTLKQALQDDNIRWVVYQPEFISGRNNHEKKFEIPINVADIVHSVAQSSVMDLASWMPLPCSDPNCGTVGFLVRKNGAWQPVSNFIDMKQFAPLITNRMNFDIDDTLSACGCDDYNLGEYLERLGISKLDIKMVFIKPFMDIRTWDADRIAACCTHVLTPQGKVDSFCRYYGTR